MKEKIICFSLGLSQEEIEKGKVSFSGLGKETHELDMIALSETMLAACVGNVLDRVMTGPAGAGKEQKDHPLSPGLYPYRVVMVNTMEREPVLQVMKSFKAILPDPQDLIFAVITDTARTWTFGEYIGHLGREHECRKTGKPGK